MSFGLAAVVKDLDGFPVFLDGRDEARRMEVDEKEGEVLLREQIERGNYVAAASLAAHLGKPHERIRELQEAAIKQYITEYRNAPGAIAIAQEFRFADGEVERLVQAIIEEARESKGKKPPWAGKRYDTKTMKYLDVEEWIAHYERELKRGTNR